MSRSKKMVASHERGSVVLDRRFEETEDVGPFVEIGEYLPCLFAGDFYLRVEIKDGSNALYAWDEGYERWDFVAESTVQFKLSALEDLLYVFRIQRDLSELGE